VLNLLVITSQDDARRRIAGLLSDAAGKVSFKQDAAEATPLVQRGLFDAVIIHAAAASEHAVDEVRGLRRARPEGFLAVIVDGAPVAWEESALSSGADVVLREPITATHLENLLRRLASTTHGNAATQTAPAMLARNAAPLSTGGRGPLEILRDFSHVLGYSLDHKLFAEHFAAKVRDIVGVARIAVFLETPRDAIAGGTLSPRLSCAAAIGIPPDVVECFELTRSAGIGARLVQMAQILQNNGDATAANGAALDQKIQREFEILGCEVAIPITDRTRTIGVAMLGGHFTGRTFMPDELQLLFLLMEELGSALKNTWLHQQLIAGHRLLADVLATLSSGCLVLDRNLQVLHANRAMTLFVKGPTAPGPASRLEFSDLPPKLANPLYDTVVKGATAQPFFFTGGPNGDRLFHASIIPFHGTGGSLPQTAMLVLEDFTQIEAAKRFEIEASKSKLIALIAKRFAHEIRNSLVPLATHEQLLESEYQNDDFRRSLKTALTRETHRIQRFTEQMLYLAQPARTPTDTVNLRDLTEICFRRASGGTAPAGRLQIRTTGAAPVVRCHQPALEHALQEIITNALQVHAEEPVVTVTIDVDPATGIRLTFRDSGSGFTEDTARQATEPFFTTRNTGIGLGLTVANKIFEDHHGRMTIAPRGPRREHDVEVVLPAADGL
jgi:nitrogen-specific signal transduction histidine kinase